MEADAPGIVELLNPIIQAGKYTVMDEPFSVCDQTEFIHRFPKRGVYHLAVSSDAQEPIGIQDVVPVSQEPQFQHIGEVSTFVSLRHHRRGVGRALFRETLLRVRQLGFVKLTATIRADNPRAVAFYRSQGFRVIGTAKKHALSCGEYLDEMLAERMID